MLSNKTPSEVAWQMACGSIHSRCMACCYLLATFTVALVLAMPAMGQQCQ